METSYIKDSIWEQIKEVYRKLKAGEGDLMENNREERRLWSEYRRIRENER